MKTNKIEITSIEKDTFRLVERKSRSSTMYMVNASSEEEALHLFECNSHQVKFVGSLAFA